MVIDPAKFTVQGDGLYMVRANQTASFTVSAPCAQIEDLGVTITGLYYCYYTGVAKGGGRGCMPPSFR